MAHDVFISHSTQDKAVADAVCAALENGRIRCWIAPRDVVPGRSFAGEIARAIKNSKAMVLIFSAHSNNSEQVLREVQLSVTAHLHIVQFRIEDVLLNDDLSYFLSTPHWLDALTPPLENHIDRLETALRALLGTPVRESVTMAASTETQTAATAAQRFRSAPSSEENQRLASLHEDVVSDLRSSAVPNVTRVHDRTETPSEEQNANVPQTQEVSTAGKALRPPLNRRRKFVFAGAIVALLTAGVLGARWFALEQSRQEAKRWREMQKERLAAAYKNSLGMKFFPVAGMSVLFSVWDTRVKDYKLFVGATQHEWSAPSFRQTDEHPAVNVSWGDATAFCQWLTEKERKEGLITKNQSYRLPTDLEWSVAVGLEESESTPEKRQMTTYFDIYPWGTNWPPPRDVGNYDPSLKVDDYKETSPVGSFGANRYGLYDMGGNVWQWCEDWWNADEKYRVLRGASWINRNRVNLLSSFRLAGAPEGRSVGYGFRCVLVVDSSR